MKILKRTALVATVLLFNGTIFAQDKNIFPDNLTSEDSMTITTIAIYPQSTRDNILLACTYADLVVKIELLQKKTSSQFKSALEIYSKETQIAIWNLSRYPELVEKLVLGGKKSKDELKAIAAQYPDEIYNTILDNGRKEFEILENINRLQKNADKEFDILLSDYPEEVKTAFNELIKNPEIIKILSEGMHTTVIIGGAYKKDKKALTDLLDLISTEYANQKARDFEEWKAGLEKNPEAKKEMQEAARSFASDEGYKDDELVVQDQRVVINYICYPYSYWMGYPWWYSYAYWYPYPYWYDWGFYWTPTGFYYFGFPSAYYSYWFFHHHHHHYYYNHFTDYSVSHYYGHRKTRTEFNHEVNHWITSNQDNLPANFFHEDNKRPDRIKELGKFSIEYNASSKRNPELSKEEYLQNNAGSYPNLHPTTSGKTHDPNEPNRVIVSPDRNIDPVYNEPAKKPQVRIPKKPEPVKPRITPKPKYEQPRNPPKVKPKVKPRK